ncbi:MAG: 6-phosphogluconolactonase [Desulfovermiculus sp.]
MLHIFPEKNDISMALASRVALVAEQAAAARGRFSVALSGGSLMDLLSPPLITAPLRSQIDWPSWEIFWADERCVPLLSPDSNFAAANRLLFKHVGIPWAQIHEIDDTLAPREAARAYQIEIKETLQPPNGQLPRFDLILLGMGQDGHTASLFPGHEVLQEKQKWVAPVLDAPKPPPERITLTLPVINYAREVIFVVTGTEKAPALRAILYEQDHGQNLPAALVDPTHGHLQWLVDEAASHQLKSCSTFK